MGIRVNSVNPGYIAGDRMDHIIKLRARDRGLTWQRGARVGDIAPGAGVDAVQLKSMPARLSSSPPTFPFRSPASRFTSTPAQ